MPTYEYECQKCNHRFEQFQSIKDEPLKRCPECKGKVKRLVGTGAGVIFKGSGFYQTDYRSSNYLAASSKDKADSSSPAPAKSDSSGSSSATKDAKKSK